MACTFVGVKGDFWTKRAPFVCPKHMQSSRRNPTYHKILYVHGARPHSHASRDVSCPRMCVSGGRLCLRPMTVQQCLVKRNYEGEC